MIAVLFIILFIFMMTAQFYTIFLVREAREEALEHLQIYDDALAREERTIKFLTANKVESGLKISSLKKELDRSETCLTLVLNELDNLSKKEGNKNA